MFWSLPPTRQKLDVLRAWPDGSSTRIVHSRLLEFGREPIVLSIGVPHVSEARQCFVTPHGLRHIAKQSGFCDDSSKYRQNLFAVRRAFNSPSEPASAHALALCAEFTGNDRSASGNEFTESKTEGLFPDREQQSDLNAVATHARDDVGCLVGAVIDHG